MAKKQDAKIVYEKREGLIIYKIKKKKCKGTKNIMINIGAD